MLFAPNIKCLAYHGPLLYEAKVLKIYDPKTKKIISKDGEKTAGSLIPQSLQQVQGYLIHYKGWKSSWDEWVGKERVLELTPENIHLQKKLKDSVLQSTMETSSKKVLSKSPAPGAESEQRQGGRRKRGGEDLEKTEDYLKRPEIHFSIPDNIKALLVNDWEFVTKDHQIVSLPRHPNVREVLEKYKAYFHAQKRTLSPLESDILDETIAGIQLYFDKALGTILLYRYERQQYKNVLESKQFQNKAPSEVYGAEHLLRLFVSFPGLIAQTGMDQRSIGVLKEHLEDVIQYVSVNLGQFILTNYETPSPAYDALSRT